MSTSEPDLEADSSETAPPKIDWRSPRSWAFFIADAAYGGAIVGVFVIVAFLVTGLFHEKKAGSFDGWWVVLIVAVLLWGLHRMTLDVWSIPVKAVRRFDFFGALPDGGHGTLLHVLYYVLGVPAGLGLIFTAQRLFALPEVWDWPTAVILIIVLIPEGTLFKLLFHRVPLMSESEPDLESSNAETARPRIDWRSPRTWRFFAADIAYSGAVAGAITIIACLLAGLFNELKAGSIEGWWLVFIVMFALSGLHLEIFARWLLPGKPARLFALSEALPGPFGALLFCTLYSGLGVAVGMVLIAIAQRLIGLPDAWELRIVTLLIATIINEGTLLKLLLHRTRNSLGS